jgi:hypothetical protein
MKHPISLRRLLSPTSRLTRQGRARRRYNCAKQDEWDERAESAIALWKAHRDTWEQRTRRPLAVADFGAGNERLRPLLAAKLEVPHEYHPYDLHPQQPSTTRLDVSKGLPDREFDLAICLGLLEYLPSVPDLATALHGACRFVITSYVTRDSPVAINHDERVRQGWTTHLSAEELEAHFSAAGFSSIGTARSDGEGTILWLWVARSC